MMEQRAKITNGKSLTAYLSKVIKEAYSSAMYERSIDEKEAQQQVVQSLAEDDDENTIAAAPETSDDDDKKAMKKGEIEVDDIVEKLNSIRSGKSFKDSAIKSAMEKYVSDLDDAEKTALFAFLKGIAQIVTGEFQGDVAVEPEDAPANIKMQKGEKKKEPFRKVIKTQVVKTPSKPKKTQSSEDTSGPVPIVPKKNK